MSDQPSKPRTIIIKLTEQERERIRQVTGEEITELPIGTMESCGHTIPDTSHSDHRPEKDKKVSPSRHDLTAREI